MSRRNLWNFAIGVVVAVALSHAAFSTLVASMLDAESNDRIFDVRRWPGESSDAFRLIGTYLREQVPEAGPGATLFAGSSVTHGYPWPRSRTFAHLYGVARRVPTINASVLAFDLSSINDWTICAAIRNRLRVSTLIIEVPIVNTAAHLIAYRRASMPIPDFSDCSGPPDSGYRSLAWSHPIGLGWFVFLWNPDEGDRPDTIMQLAPVPADYFTSAADFNAVAAEFDTEVASVIANARRVADHVYLFASPVFIPGLKEIGEDADAVRAQMTRAIAACEAAGGAHCLDVSFLGEHQENFSNFTHLNQAGHRQLADWLASQIR